MTDLIEEYQKLIGVTPIDQLKQMAKVLKGIKVVHVNSTRFGGGVAEILEKMIPLSNAVGINASWEVIKGTPEFFQCTKIFHNAMQGKKVVIPDSLLRTFEEINAFNADELRGPLTDADIVIIHDPQPLPLITHFPQRKNKWIWRCHIDATHANRSVWRYLSHYASKYDASIFSLEDFAQPLPHPMYLIPPSIDPFSEKNRALPEAEIASVYERFGIDPLRPMILQVSRFDYFKDPLGVVQAYRLAKKFQPDLQLVLAGGTATDDPESDIVLAEVKTAAGNDPDIHILYLPPDAHHTINALQCAATIVLQKSNKEGFGLTVTEALWKGKPVIGGNVGGIRLQVINYHTGFLVETPEGAALRIRYLLQSPSQREYMGRQGKVLVKDNFLNVRHLRDYLTVMASLLFPNEDRIEINKMAK